MPLYIAYSTQEAGIYTPDEMVEAYTKTANKRKYRTFTAWINALLNDGKIEIAQEDANNGKKFLFYST